MGPAAADARRARRVTHLVAPVLATLGAALVLGACATSSPEQAVAEASENTTQSGSAKVAFDSRIEAASGQGAQSLDMTGEGVVDYENQRGHLTFDMSDFTEALGGGVPPEASEVEIVSDDLVIYMRWPLMARFLPESKPWVKVDLRSAAEDMGIDLGQIAQLGQTDPSQSLQYLRGASNFEEVGEEDVRDVATTHYRGAVDLQKFAEGEAEGVRESVERLIELTGDKEMPAEVWIDGDGLIRRMRYNYSMPARTTAGAEERAKITMTMELFDFGTEVDISLPPRDEVIDVGELQQQQQP